MSIEQKIDALIASLETHAKALLMHAEAMAGIKPAKTAKDKTPAATTELPPVNAGTPAPFPTAAQAASLPASATAAPAPASTTAVLPAGAVAPTYDEIVKRCQALMAKLGDDGAMKILTDIATKLGVPALRNLAVEQYGAAMQYLDVALNPPSPAGASPAAAAAPVAATGGMF